MYEIASAVGVEPATLHYIKNCGRKRIMWSTGVGLYNLWLKRVQHERETA